MGLGEMGFGRNGAEPIIIIVMTSVLLPGGVMMTGSRPYSLCSLCSDCGRQY